jgi:transcriptional regulator with XRE-family HTH domain
MLRLCLQMDWQLVSQQWLSAVRGRRSQRVLSRRLGLGANAVYRWESGRCAPSAPAALRLAERAGVRVDDAIFTFLGVPERDWVAGFGFATADGVRSLLERVRGERSFIELSEATGFNRFALSRWFRGTSSPTLPQLLALLEATTHRVLDFIAAFTDPARLPSVAQAWRVHLASRNAAFDAPWSHAVLRTLELAEYAKLDTPDSAWIARRLGIGLDEAERCVHLLSESRQIKLERKHWVVDEQAVVVDTGQDPARARELRRFWLAEALQRFDHGARGAFGYNLFTVSEKDYEALKQLYVQYFEGMRRIVANSTPGEKLVLFCGQLVEMA